VRVAVHDGTPRDARRDDREMRPKIIIRKVYMLWSVVDSSFAPSNVYGRAM